MANEFAIKGIQSILCALETDELLKLVATSTENLINLETIKTKKEAIDVIIRHSTDFSTILNRKIVRKELLFQYVDENNIAIIKPATKLSLINQILRFWEKQQNAVTTANNTNQIVAETTSRSEENINVMATKFAEWFYSIFNENHPIGEEHFWNDCSLKLMLVSDGSNLENSVENDKTELVNLLYSTKCKYGLYFNPNLTSDGVRGKMDNHGLVMVFSCGTLHTKDTCVGVYEQIFSLARDPFSDNNWKIKNTQLCLKSKPVVNYTPKLKDTSFNNEICTLNK